MNKQPNEPNTLDDIVFEHRNRQYGAYELRKAYRSNLQRAFFTGTMIFVGLFSAPLIFAKLNPESKQGERIVIACPMILPPDVEPPIEKPKPEEPPKEQEPVQTERFVPPLVVENDKLEEVPPTQEELKDALIGPKTIEGEKPDDALVIPVAPNKGIT